MNQLQRTQFLVRLALQEFAGAPITATARGAIVLEKIQADLRRAFVTLNQVIEAEEEKRHAPQADRGVPGGVPDLG